MTFDDLNEQLTKLKRLHEIRNENEVTRYAYSDAFKQFETDLSEYVKFSGSVHVKRTTGMQEYVTGTKKDYESVLKDLPQSKIVAPESSREPEQRTRLKGEFEFASEKSYESEQLKQWRRSYYEVLSDRERLTRNWCRLFCIGSIAGTLVAVIMFKLAVSESNEMRRIIAAQSRELREMQELYPAAQAHNPKWELRKYNWSPPTPSDRIVTAPSWLTTNLNLENVYKRVTRVIEGDHNDLNFGKKYGVYDVNDDGFLIATAPERILESGEIATSRWDTGRLSRYKKSFKDQIVDFFDWAPEGRYRFFFIAVTPQDPPSFSRSLADWNNDSRSSEIGNRPFLPEAMGTNAITGAYRLHIYLYYFERAKLETFPHCLQSRIDVIDHLKFAGISSLLFPSHDERKLNKK